MRQFQIIFTPVAASELAKMPKELQLNIIGDFRGLPQQVYCDNDSFGKLERNGRILHRFRLGDYRVYFEKHELGVLIHRILNRNTLKDFLFRSNISLGEDQILENTPRFWELIEAGKHRVSGVVRAELADGVQNRSNLSVLPEKGTVQPAVYSVSGAVGGG